METSFSLLFYLKKRKNYQSGPIPIYGRITINGKRSEFSTGRSCLPERWDSTGGKPKGTNEESKSLKRHLDAIQKKAYEDQTNMLLAGKFLTADNLRNAVTGKNDQQMSLIEIFQQHNDDMKKLIGQKFAKGTWTNYNTCLKHIKAFMKWHYNTSDFDIRAIDHAFITRFEFWLHQERKCENNSALKHIKNFAKIINLCLANGWIKEDPFRKFEFELEEVETVFLMGYELEAIWQKKINIQRTERVRDIFVFSCYTGLSYAEVKNLTKNNIVIGIDGKLWIHIFRQKTGVECNIPLLPIALEIMNKYSNDPEATINGRVLPVLSNQKMNAYLKEIADCCEIQKEITYHVARHTFATTVTLANGVPLETVSKMLGHKTLEMTQHYAKILKQKVSEDMGKLREKLESQSLKIASAV